MSDSGILYKGLLVVSLALLATIVIMVLVGVSALDSSTHAVAQSVRAQQLAQAITDERKQTLLAYCRAQNARHDATVHEINVLIARRVRHLGAAQRAEVRASRASTLLLINALVPHQDCRNVVATQTSP
jgi:hypothetical protein